MAKDANSKLDVSEEIKIPRLSFVATGVLCAFLIRWIPTVWPRFWYDEIFTIGLASHPFSEIIPLTASDVHPPLYYFLVHLMMNVGAWFGGWSHSLAWLRLTSIVPGVLLCLAGWWAARRYWDRESAGWVLFLFAFSPPLIHYSLELRSFALLQFFLFSATVLLAGVTSGRASNPWLATMGYGVCMTLALYTHSIAILYFAAHGLLVLGEIFLHRSNAARLFLYAGAAGMLVVILYAPWIPVICSQREVYQQGTVGWFPPPHGRDLISSLFLYGIYGPLGTVDPASAWQGVNCIMMLITFSLLGLLFIRNPSAMKSNEANRDGFDRWTVYCATLTVAPLVIAYLITASHRANFFLATRYNIIMAPFWLCVLCRLMTRLQPWRSRGIVSGVALLWFVLFSLGVRIEKVKAKTAADQIWDRVDEDASTDESRLYWLDENLLPWLDRCGAVQFASYRQALDAAAESAHPFWFVSSHAAGKERPFTSPESILFQSLLDSDPRVQKVDVSAVWGWEGLWRVEPKDLLEMNTVRRKLRRNLRSRRRAITKGQVILPDDEAFLWSKGWGQLELDSNQNSARWSLGDEQRVDWKGPARSGDYDLIARFWRTHPYPQPQLSVEYQLPGERRWRRVDAPVGEVTFQGRIHVRESGQKLRLALKIPSWIPAETNPGSKDRRALGFQFSAIELHPVTAEEPLPE